MAKISNAVRIVKFDSEYELYRKLEQDLISCYDEPLAECIKLKNHAILYFEADLENVMTKFMYNGAIVRFDDALDDINFLHIHEIKLMNELGTVTICGREYEIDEIKYHINSDGCRYVTVFLI